MMSAINETFYLSKDEPIRSCLLSLRSFIIQKNEAIMETQKYGMPCFCLSKNILCYLWLDKKSNQPYILFADGKNLPFKELDQGMRSKMKILRINPNRDLPKKTIEKILNAAIALKSYP